MKKIIISLSVLLLSCFFFNENVNAITNTSYTGDSIVNTVKVYFSRGETKKLAPEEYKKLSKFILWAKKNPLIPITITGWAGKTGTEFQNVRVSLLRAKTVRNYLVKKGISSSRIDYLGAGVDSLLTNNKLARRVDVAGGIELSLALPLPSKESDIGKLIVNDKKVAKSRVIYKDSLPVNDELFSKEYLSKRKITYLSSSNSLESSLFYAGVGVGLSFGKGTLKSLSKYGNYAGLNISLLGGYRLSDIYKPELFMNYTRLKLYSDKCCGDYLINDMGYIVDKVGVNTYELKEIHSVSRVFTIGGRVVIDLVPIWDRFSRWSALIIPNISCVYNRANVKDKTSSIYTRTNYHFAIGMDIGPEYSLNDFISLRLTTGINFITGRSIDGLSKERHKTNYILSTMFNVVFNY